MEQLDSKPHHRAPERKPRQALAYCVRCHLPLRVHLVIVGDFGETEAVVYACGFHEFVGDA